MTLNRSYPGVYIEETPRGIRSISGVTTSVAAFVGWSARGDLERPTLVHSWEDFECICGGLDTRSFLGYSVYHFFKNGGQTAYIVRLAADDAETAEVTVDGKIRLVARNPGDWANDYAIATRITPNDADRFCLSVLSVAPGNSEEIVAESFDDLSMSSTDPRDAVKVIGAESSIIRAEIIGEATTPPADTAPPLPRLTGAGNLDGTVLEPNTAAFEEELETSISLLDRVDFFNLLCVPGETNPAQISLLQKYCGRNWAFLIADCDEDATFTSLQSGPGDALTGGQASYSAYYFPWIRAPDPLKEGRLREFPPCGFVAGVIARTDATSGVWKAPAGSDADLVGAAGTRITITDPEAEALNNQGVNCLRDFGAVGPVLWGARTLRGIGQIDSDYRYIPTRRLALHIEESLYRGTKWVVFEPNDEPLWAALRLNIGTFMHALFRQGAFQGRSAHQAYFVKCDKETTTENDRNLGRVNIVVGFAPLKPAEFVIISIQQIAGQSGAWETVIMKPGVRTHHIHPFKNFSFLLKCDGRTVAGFSKVSGLECGTELVEHRESGESSLSSKSPGRTGHSSVTLERGLIQDTKFEKWTNTIWNSSPQTGKEIPPEHFCKDLVIELYNQADQLALAYKVFRCCVTQCTALPELDSNPNVVAIESLTLQHEGWERDNNVVEQP